MESIAAPPLAVLNPGGKDTFVDYASGPPLPGGDPHPPVNFHAYAAATHGAFFDSTADLCADPRFPITLLLIRARISASLKAARLLKQAGKRILVAWKECGALQIGEQLQAASAFECYRSILELADGVVSPTLELPPLAEYKFANSREGKVFMVPTPYPVDIAEWDFSAERGKRHGLLVGTRDFSNSARLHMRALSAAATLAQESGCLLTVINGNGHRGRRLLDAFRANYARVNFNFIDRPLDYLSYLRLIAKHRILFQLDQSLVPGQVAGDALLARTLCIGGNSTLERIAFAGLAAHPMENARLALTDDKFYDEQIELSQKTAAEHLSFGSFASRWSEIASLL